MCANKGNNSQFVNWSIFPKEFHSMKHAQHMHTNARISKHDTYTIAPTSKGNKGNELSAPHVSVE